MGDSRPRIRPAIEADSLESQNDPSIFAYHERGISGLPIGLSSGIHSVSSSSVRFWPTSESSKAGARAPADADVRAPVRVK